MEDELVEDGPINESGSDTESLDSSSLLKNGVSDEITFRRDNNRLEFLDLKGNTLLVAEYASLPTDDARVDHIDEDKFTLVFRAGSSGVDIFRLTATERDEILKEGVPHYGTAYKETVWELGQYTLEKQNRAGKFEDVTASVHSQYKSPHVEKSSNILIQAGGRLLRVHNSLNFNNPEAQRMMRNLNSVMHTVASSVYVGSSP